MAYNVLQTSLKSKLCPFYFLMLLLDVLANAIILFFLLVRLFRQLFSI